MYMYVVAVALCVTRRLQFFSLVGYARGPSLGVGLSRLPDLLDHLESHVVFVVLQALLFGVVGRAYAFLKA